MAYQAAMLARNAAPSVAPYLQPETTSASSSGEQGQKGVVGSVPCEPVVTVILPARNEERNIVPCLHSLLSQTVGRHPVEIVAVDDASTDGTGTLLEHLQADFPSLHVTHTQVKPEGWAGKPHAMHLAAQQTHGTWLLFTDADTRWQPGAVAALITYAESHALDMLTTLPRQVLPTLLERLVAPALVSTLFLIAPPSAINSPKRKVAAANGQCILLRRVVYEAIGGYARPDLRAALIDDTALAQVLKRQGYLLHVASGQQLLAVQMYPSGREAWQGWLRSLGASFQPYSRLTSTALLGTFAAFQLAPYALTLAGIRHWRRTGRPSETLVTGLFALGVTLTAFGWAVRALCLPLRYVFCHPASLLAQLAVMAHALLRHLRGQPLMWKDRTYPASPQSTPSSNSSSQVAGV